jgi:hypothetical protein
MVGLVIKENEILSSPVRNQQVILEVKKKKKKEMSI